mmetsp:Transcript_16766/g.35381  ORF Transcript_16766/g.35381 Transcript_16766/m.35381 type:complete len:239 (-) Transcript_16766:756-1472(-)
MLASLAATVHSLGREPCSTATLLPMLTMQWTKAKRCRAAMLTYSVEPSSREQLDAPLPPAKAAARLTVVAGVVAQACDGRWSLRLGVGRIAAPAPTSARPHAAARSTPPSIPAVRSTPPCPSPAPPPSPPPPHAAPAVRSTSPHPPPSPRPVRLARSNLQTAAVKKEKYSCRAHLQWLPGCRSAALASAGRQAHGRPASLARWRMACPLVRTRLLPPASPTGHAQLLVPPRPSQRPPR